MTLDKFFRLFDELQNTLCHPSKWDDPFENLIVNVKVKRRDGSLQEIGLREGVFGQCWTMQHRSDALWQIYCTGKDRKAHGVRIRTTLRKLGETFSRATATAGGYHAFIGKVDYLSDAKLLARAVSISKEPNNPNNIARSMLMKRTAFKHEEEVRLVFRLMAGTPPHDGLFRYSVDPHALIDQVMIDPRFKPAEAAMLKNEFPKRTNFRGEILYSLLYTLPKGFVPVHVAPSVDEQARG